MKRRENKEFSKEEIQHTMQKPMDQSTNQSTVAPESTRSLKSLVSYLIEKPSKFSSQIVDRSVNCLVD